MSFTDPVPWSALPGWLQVSPCEIVASLSGFASVYLTVRNKVGLWPAGIVSVLCYAWLFYSVKLYPDMVLQVLFLGLSVQGWLRWGRETNHDSSIKILRWGQALILLVALGAVYLATGTFFARITQSALPWWDSAILVLSLFAQGLLTYHYRENWYLWIAVDLLALYVYSAKELYLTLILYALFLVMAVIGCVEWHRRTAKYPTPTRS